MEKQQIEKKKVGRNSSEEANKKQPENEKEEEPAAIITETIRNVRYDYHFLKTVHSLEELDNFRFQNYCDFLHVKRNINTFTRAKLDCLNRSEAKGRCRYSLLVRRLHPESNDIHVYAHSEHNHPLKPEVERAVQRGPKGVLAPDANPPANFTNPDGRQWTFLGTAKDEKKADKFRRKHHCRRRADEYIYSKTTMMCTTSRIKCKFHLLALKTERNRYHMYAHGRHICRYAEEEENAASTKSVKTARNDEEEVEDGEEEEVEDGEEEEMEDGEEEEMEDGEEEEMEDGEEEEQMDDEEESVEEEVEEEGGLEESAEDAADPSTTTSNKNTTDEPKERPIEEGTKHQLMEKKRKRRHHQCSMDNNNGDEEDIFQQQPLENTADDDRQSSLNLAEQLRKMEEKLASQGVESRAEIDSVKAENRVFLEKNNVMAAKMGELQARLEVAELKAKMANDQMAKLVDDRVAKLAGQWTEKLMSQAEKKIEELGQEFASKMDKQFQKGMTEFERKMTQLECQAAICQTKQEEFAAKLASFEAANQQNEELLCSNDYRWDSTGHVQVDEKDAGKTSWTNVVRAQMPTSRTSLTAVPGRLVYYEVLVRNEESAKYFYYIGWVGPDFPLEHSWVGSHPGSCAINATGEFWQSDNKHGGYADGFHAGDVVGSGLLLTKAGQLGLFFTKNGRLNGKPIVLDHNKQQKTTSLYPAASFSPANASMEANFGTDPAGKPFRFDLDAHRALLFDIN